ncbi:MAG: hypothetical protein ACEQSU_13210 [Microgenomates group bacterium]
MEKFDRRFWGLDSQFGLFLVIAPMASVVVFAAYTATDAAVKLDFEQGLFAFVAILIGSIAPLIFHYLVAIIPSAVVWALTTGLAKAVGFSSAAAVRFAAILTGLVAATLISVWARDSDYVAFLPRMIIIVLFSSYLTVEALMYFQKSATKR